MIKNLVVIVSGGALAFGLAGAVSPAMAMASVAHPAGVTRANLPMPQGTPIIRGSTARMSGPGRLSAPPDTPIVRGSNARHTCGHPVHLRLWNPAAPPTIRDAKARPSGTGHNKISAPPDTPTVRDSGARPGCVRPGHLRLWNPSDPPIIRDSVDQNAPPTIRDAKARPSDAGHIKPSFAPDPPPVKGSHTRPGGAHCVKLTNPGPTPIIRDSTAQLGDPDGGGQVTQAARLSDPDDGGQ